MQNYFAVTILVNASKPCFKGSYSDVPALPTGCTPLASVGDPDCLLTYADLPKVKHSKNLGNNDIFSKILVTKNGEVCDGKRVKEQYCSYSIPEDVPIDLGSLIRPV